MDKLNEAVEAAEAETESSMPALVEKASEQFEEFAASLLRDGAESLRNARDAACSTLRNAAGKVTSFLPNARRIHAGPGAAHDTKAPTLNSPTFPARSTLRARFRGKVLGVELGLDVYLANPFRILGLPASATARERDTVRQRYTSLRKVDLRLAIRLAVPCGYEDLIAAEEYDEIALAGLRDPHRRLLAELFWPHIGGATWTSFRSDPEGIASLGIWARMVRVTEDEAAAEGLLALHAAAVLAHNFALKAELCNPGVGSEAGDEAWAESLRLWSALMAEEAFWDYLADRIDSYDDPRIGREDLLALRLDLPVALLSFHSMLAAAYAQSGNQERCRIHLALAQEAPLPENARHLAVGAGLDAIGNNTIKPLTDRVKARLGKGTGRMDYRAFSEICNPMVDEAFSIRAMLAGFLADGLDSLDFDPFIQTLHQAASQRIEFRGESREEALLYSVLLGQRLLELPVSSALAVTLRQGIRNDRKHLYGDFEDENCDPSCCWFLDGAPVDPASSESLVFHKITDTSGSAVRWRTQKIIIPRSKLAKRCHSKSPPQASDLAAELVVSGKELWSPPAETDVAPLEIAAGKVQISSLLDLLETASTKPEHLKTVLGNGRLAEWLRDRGHAPLAASIPSGGTSFAASWLPVLRSVAACDVWWHVLQSGNQAEALVDVGIGQTKTAFEETERELGEQIRMAAAANRHEIQTAMAEEQTVLAVDGKINIAFDSACQSLKQECSETRQQAAEALLAASQACRSAQASHDATSKLGAPRARITTIQGTLAFGASLAAAGMGGRVVGPAGILGGLLAGACLTLLLLVGNAITRRREYRRTLATLRSEITQTTETEAFWKQQLASIDQSVDRPLAAAREPFTTRLTQARAKVEGLTQSLRAKCSQEASALAHQLKQNAAPLLSTLARLGECAENQLAQLARTFTPRPRTTMDFFPPLKKIRSAGFSPGEKPSESEIRSISERQVRSFLDSLSYSEKRKIAVLMGVAGSEKGAEMVGTLIAMEPGERRRILAQLPDFL